MELLVSTMVFPLYLRLPLEGLKKAVLEEKEDITALKNS
jgi:hypothetical protein